MMCSVRVDYVGGRGAGKCAGRALRALPALSINAYRDSHVFVLHANTLSRSQILAIDRGLEQYSPDCTLFEVPNSGSLDIQRATILRLGESSGYSFPRDCCLGGGAATEGRAYA